MRNKLLAYMGGLGALVIGAILLSIRQQLIAFGPWVIGVLLAMISLVTVYYLHKLYVQFRLNHLRLKSQMMEISQHEQDLLDQETRRQLAIGQFALNSHVTRTRIYPDAKGYLPMLAGDDMRTLPGQLDLLMLPQFNRGSGQRQLPEHADSRQGELTQELPASVRYEDIIGQIPEGHSVLGISERGLETCDFKDLMTMLICGGSSTGKSNTIAIKLREAMQIGRNTRIIVIDPHAGKPDSLYNKIEQYESRFLMPVARKDDEIVKALNWFKTEFQRRLELSTEELEELDDILLVCDEVFALVFHHEDERIAKLIKLVSGIAGYESRGYGMFAWFSTQRVSGLKWLRDAVMTTICHKIQTMSERVLASNDDRTVARDMNNWTMKGRVVVFGLNLPVTVTQMPYLKVVEGSASHPDEMEPLAPNPLRDRRDVPRSSGTPRYIEAEAEIGDGPDAQNDALRGDSGENVGYPSNVRTFPFSQPQQPVAQADTTPEGRPKDYRLSETEIGQFLAAYRVSGNVDKALTAINKGTRFRQHAREVLVAHNTRQA